jgi:superoxide dismutase, Cu-Zn family
MTHTGRTGLLFALLTAGLAFGQSPPAATPPPAAAVPPPPAPAAGQPKTVELKDQKGKQVGTVLLVDTPHGLLLRGTLTGLPPGTHAIHFHEFGKCESPFKTSGGHYNPTKKNHGMLDPGGLHAGDLPNLVIPKSGKLDFELFAEDLTLADGPNTVLDADGTALVIHAKADDYKSQPAGDAGDRIACGIIAK